MQAFTTEVKTK